MGFPEFLTSFQHLLTLKIKDPKLIWQKMVFKQYNITKMLELHGSVCGLRIRIRIRSSRSRIWVTKKDLGKIYQTVVLQGNNYICFIFVKNHR